MNNLQFKTRKVSKTATIICNGNIEVVFSLLGAFKGRKWEEGWELNLIFSKEEKSEESTKFTT